MSKVLPRKVLTSAADTVNFVLADAVADSTLAAMDAETDAVATAGRALATVGARKEESPAFEALASVVAGKKICATSPPTLILDSEFLMTSAFS
jgi:hypothetical protein